MAADRTVLLLQGPRSPFFARLADALSARGARVERAVLCPGDALFWLGRRAWRFRGAPAAWPAWIAARMAAAGVTDVVGLGDGRAAHRDGFAAARAQGARVHVVEQGYLRPGWLTVEPDRLAAWRPGPAPAPPHDGVSPAPRGAGFAWWAAMDVAWDLANLALGWALHPGHRSHTGVHPLAEWGGWARKALAWPTRRRARDAALARLAAHQGPRFLLALQLDADFMVRDHGPPGGVDGALTRALASFRRAAPADALLAVKPHPLDPQRAPWRARVEAAGALWLDGGDLDALLPRLAGVVVVNSTLGLTALRAGRPAAVLGRCVYEGLAWRGDLDRFWAAPPAPDPDAVAAFVAALVAEVQVPGGFDGPAMAVGAEAVAERVLRRSDAP